MNFQLGYNEEKFCKDAISKWAKAEPELLEGKKEVHNCMAIIAEGIRSKTIDASEVFAFLEDILKRPDAVSEIENAVAISFIEFAELPGLELENKVTPLVKDVMEKQHERWESLA